MKFLVILLRTDSDFEPQLSTNEKMECLNIYRSMKKEKTQSADKDPLILPKPATKWTWRLDYSVKQFNY